jgi:hypothetical protein
MRPLPARARRKSVRAKSVTDVVSVRNRPSIPWRTALNTFRLHALIHEHTALHHDPAGLLAMLNERLKAVLSPGQFATFLYVLVDSSVDRISGASRRRTRPIGRSEGVTVPRDRSRPSSMT